MAHERFEKLSLDTTSTSSSTISSRRQNAFATISTSQTQIASDVQESAIIDDDASDSTKEDDGGLMMHGSLTRESQMSKLREQLHQRGTSIKFDSVAKLDNGHVHALDTPLPRSAGADDDSMGEEDAQNGHAAQPYYIPIKQRQRRHSETEKEEFDPITGAPLDSGRNRRPYLEGELRYPLVQATVDELARERGYGAAPLAEPPSLTSERTASPVMEEVQTPVNGHLLSPIHATASPIDFSHGESRMRSRRGGPFHNAALEVSAVWADGTRSSPILHPSPRRRDRFFRNGRNTTTRSENQIPMMRDRKSGMAVAT
jgi:hypothetical protein